MKAAKRTHNDRPSTRVDVLLHELREECERTVRLIQELEAGPRSAPERDDLLGELSAAVLHLHEHTRGLDEVLCDTE